MMRRVKQQPGVVVMSEGPSSVITLVFSAANYNQLGKDAINIPRSHDRVSIKTSGR